MGVKVKPIVFLLSLILLAASFAAVEAVVVSDDVPGGVEMTTTASTATPTLVPVLTAVPSTKNVVVSTPVGPILTPVVQSVAVTPLPTPLSPTAPKFQKIYFVSNVDGQWSVYSVNLDGTGQIKITKTDLSLNRWSYYSPVVSPDGKNMLLVMTRNVRSYLYLRDMATSKGKRISASTDYELDPAWSADNQEMAFVSLRNRNIPQVFAAPRRGWPEKQITEGDWPCTHPCFSPDGKSICFVSKRDNVESIYTMTLDGKGLKRLTNADSADFYPCWSPDGKDVLFVSTRDKKYQIYTTDAATGVQATKLSDGQSNDKDPCYSPDGQSIVFVSDRDGNDEIYMMDKDGKNRRRVTFNHASSRQPCWR